MAALRELERIKGEFGPGPAARRLELLDRLAAPRLESGKEVARLHECLVFARAYPDGPEVLERVEKMLAGFSRRRDLRRFRGDLVDSGIAGTDLYFSFFWWTAQWLARRWPDRITVDWSGYERADALESVLHLLVPYCESPALDEFALPVREWIDDLKGPGETDAAFLIRRCAKVRADGFLREKFYEDLDLWMRLAPGPGTPERTTAKHPVEEVHFQTRPLRRQRPSLPDAIRQPPLSVRAVPPAEANRLVEMTRAAMVARTRDLDAFMHADRNDVRMVDCGEGLRFACFGVIPERRLMLEAVYGFLTLMNGVPIGYVLSSAFCASSEVAYNVFSSYRGGEAGWVYGRIISMLHHLFGSDTFTVDPYQLGYGNKEGLESGAWWFYYKMGFRPRDPAIQRLVAGEMARLRKNPRHRTPVDTLETLASENMYLHLGRKRDDVLGLIGLGDISLHASRHLAQRFGADRERGLTECAREAGRLLGVRSTKSWSPGERLAWERWAPLVCVLPGVKRWGAANRRALVEVIRAKGGRRESEFVLLSNRHQPLRRALMKLAEG